MRVNFIAFNFIGVFPYVYNKEYAVIYIYRCLFLSLELIYTYSIK